MDTEHANLGFGQETECLHDFAAASWCDQGSLFSRERQLSRSSDGRSRGGIDGRSSTTVPAWVDFGEGPVILADDGYDGTLPSQFRAIPAEDKFEYRDFTSLIVPSRRASVFLDANWLWRGDVRVFVEGLATDYGPLTMWRLTSWHPHRCSLALSASRLPLPLISHSILSTKSSTIYAVV